MKNILKKDPRLDKLTPTGKIIYFLVNFVFLLAIMNIGYSQHLNLVVVFILGYTAFLAFNYGFFLKWLSRKYSHTAKGNIIKAKSIDKKEK